MSLFQCQNCGCLENTALSAQGFKVMARLFDWSYAPEREGLRICSACGPTNYKSGKPTEFGKWHGVFSRTYYPIGEFVTDDVGNLKHAVTGLSSCQFKCEFPDRMIEAAKRQEGGKDGQ